MKRQRGKAEADRSRNLTSRIQYDELTCAMGRLQAQFEARLRIVLNDPKPIDETKRLQRALNEVADTGPAERDWIKEKNQLVLQERHISIFNEESRAREVRLGEERNETPRKKVEAGIARDVYLANAKRCRRVEQ